MAEALIKGLIAGGAATGGTIAVHDPSPERQDLLRLTYRVNVVPDNQAVLDGSTVVVLAVKPQMMDQVIAEVGRSFTPAHTVVSIAAGVTLAGIEAGLNPGVPVIRVMPNTPALVQSGAAAMAPGSSAGPEHVAQARAVFAAVGLVVDLDERYLDAVTGLSGSGPAYVFIFLEALTDGAVRMGLPRAQARLLAAQTVLGAARLALESGAHPGELKDMVTSPGGTTAAGLHALEKGGFRALVQDAVAASTIRSRELGKK